MATGGFNGDAGPSSAVNAVSDQRQHSNTAARHVNDVTLCLRSRLNPEVEPFSMSKPYRTAGAASFIPSMPPVRSAGGLQHADLPFSMVDEILERQSKQNNVMLFNLPEPSSHVQDATSADMAAIVNILAYLELSDIRPIHIYRLGDPTEHSLSMPRPVKLILENRRDTFRIFGAQHRLRNSENGWLRLYFVSDRTRMQRDYIHRLREIIFLRQAKGETGLVIKYVRGTPVIAKHIV